MENITFGELANLLNPNINYFIWSIKLFNITCKVRCYHFWRPASKRYTSVSFNFDIFKIEFIYSEMGIEVSIIDKYRNIIIDDELANLEDQTLKQYICILPV
jgi:hypothetical protein